MYAKDVFLVFYRNGFNVSLILIFLAIINLILTSENKRNYFWLGIVFYLLLITREDFFWLLPGLIYVLMVKKDKLIWKAVPFTITLILFTATCTLNYLYYKAFTHNELSFSSFNKAYTLITKISNSKNDNLDLQEKLIIASNNSPTFKEIYEIIKARGILEKNIYKPNHIFWAVREVAGYLGYFSSYEESSRYFEKIEYELKKAEAENKITIKRSTPTIIISTSDLNNIKEVPSLFIKGFSEIINYKTLIIDNEITLDNKSKTEFELLTNSTTINQSDAESINRANISILRNILVFYQVTGMIIFITGFLSWIMLIRKKQKHHIESILLGLSIILVIGISYAEATSFSAMRYYYLAPGYIIISLFSILSINNYFSYKYFCKGESHEVNSTNTLL